MGPRLRAARADRGRAQNSGVSRSADERMQNPAARRGFCLRAKTSRSSLPGLPRQSSFLPIRWMTGSSPGMTLSVLRRAMRIGFIPFQSASFSNCCPVCTPASGKADLLAVDLCQGDRVMSAAALMVSVLLRAGTEAYAARASRSVPLAHAAPCGTVLITTVPSCHLQGLVARKCHEALQASAASRRLSIP